jgi:uncharacterized protein YdgA (DUF945 family)
MNSLKVAVVDANGSPFEAELAGLTVASNLEKSTFGFYTGQNTVELTDTKLTMGPQKAVLTLKGFEQKDTSDTKDNNLAGRVDYKIDEIGYQGKPVGSGRHGPEHEERRRAVDAGADQALSGQDGTRAGRRCRR